MTLPMIAAQPMLGEPPPPPDPLAPGPFAFADPDRLRGILEGAGFVDIDISPHDEKTGSPTLDEAVEVALRVGPLGSLMREHPEQAAVVIGAVRRSLEPYVAPGGVRLPSATWIVTAQALNIKALAPCTA